MLFRIAQNIQTTLLVIILLCLNYYYFGIYPQEDHFAPLFGIITALLIPLYYFSIGHWEGVLLLLAAIGFNSLFLIGAWSGIDPAVFSLSLIFLALQIDFLTRYIALSFRKSLLTRLIGSAPHIMTVLLGLLITGMVGYGMLIYVPESGLSGYLELIAWFVSSLIVCVTIALFVPEILIHHRMQKIGYPYTLRMVLRTLMAYTLFITGCLLLTVFGFVLFVLFPWPSNETKRKLYYHKTIKSFCKILILATARGLTIIDQNRNTFDHPSVIIANHQSFIDLIVIQSLHPKMVLLTNDWVWSSPLFGAVARWADYYPVSSGIENSLETLQKTVNKGYSIAVFPEGSRSKDKEIKRFKKGAFYLAEKLNLDILPVVFHGTGEGITKKEFVLKKTSLTAAILPKIPPESGSPNQGYSKRGNTIAKTFKQEYNRVRNDCETPGFLNNRLLLKFAYQGYSPLKQVRYTVKCCRDLLGFLFSRAYQTGVVHAGSNYGEIIFLMNEKFPNLAATGLEWDKTKTGIAKTVAENCIQAKIQFLDLQDHSSIDHECDLALINMDRSTIENRLFRSLLGNLSERLSVGGLLVFYSQSGIDTDSLQEHSGFLNQSNYKTISSIPFQALVYTK